MGLDAFLVESMVRVYPRDRPACIAFFYPPESFLHRHATTVTQKGCPNIPAYWFIPSAVTGNEKVPSLQGRHQNGAGRCTPESTCIAAPGALAC